MLVAILALFIALGGSVYAAKKHKILGTAIKVKSLPGNRLKPHSVTADRLKVGALSGSQLQPGSVTGAQINEATLGQVPTAQYAEKATSALDAQTALNAVNAVNATTVNGHSAGCLPGTQLFAGSCWQSSASEAATTAPSAAAACASQGGELPSALALAAFASHVTLDAGGEWAGDIPVISGKNVYAVIAISPGGDIESASSSSSKKFRCVIPLVT